MSIITTSSARPRTSSGSGDLVVQRLQVLDVHGRIDVDSGVEYVIDVLVALGVLDPRGVGVGELVDQTELRRARQDPRQVHLLQRRAAVGHAPPRDDR